MNDACTAEPISFLRLERYLLEEVAFAERARIAAHLAECAACRACFAELRASDVQVPPLPAALVPGPRRGLRALPLRRSLAFAAALAAAAMVLLSLRSALDEPALRSPPSRLPAVKGGELAIELVRERGGDIAREPDVFREGDRFEVLVTCPPGAAAHWDFVVFQAGQAFFPISAEGLLQCGNHVPLPGAFRLSGRDPATVCVILDTRSPIDRARLAADQARALPATSKCRVIAPER
jgi:hypothetical protein